MSNETSVNVAIKGEKSVPDIAPADTQITLAEDGTDTKHDLTITDSDLGADIKKYDFDLVGKGTTEIGREIKSAAGSEYSFEVKQGNVLYGKLHMEVNLADPKNVKYWFEVDGSVKDILFNNNKIDLNFDIVFKNEYGGASTGKILLSPSMVRVLHRLLLRLLCWMRIYYPIRKTPRRLKLCKVVWTFWAVPPHPTPLPTLCLILYWQRLRRHPSWQH